MSMDRKGFLRSLALGAGGLVVGEQALEAFARLTHVRKSFPSAAIPSTRIVLQKPYGIEDAYALTSITIGTTVFGCGAIIVPPHTSIATEIKQGLGIVSIDGKALLAAPIAKGESFSFKYESFTLPRLHWFSLT